MHTQDKYVLTLNLGSSSCKFAVIDHNSFSFKMHGLYEKLNSHSAKLIWHDQEKSITKSLLI